MKFEIFDRNNLSDLFFSLVASVLQMQEVGSSQRGSQRAFSVLDRLLLTHPVWLQLSLNQEAALYILLREPVGVRNYQSYYSYYLIR